MFLMKLCFFMSLAGTVMALFVIAWRTPGERFLWHNSKVLTLQIMLVPGSVILWLYSLYFYFRHDRSPGKLFWLLLFPFLYPLLYFYEVIWGQEKG